MVHLHSWGELAWLLKKQPVIGESRQINQINWRDSNQDHRQKTTGKCTERLQKGLYFNILYLRFDFPMNQALQYLKTINLNKDYLWDKNFHRWHDFGFFRPSTHLKYTNKTPSLLFHSIFLTESTSMMIKFLIHSQNINTALIYVYGYYSILCRYIYVPNRICFQCYS